VIRLRQGRRNPRTLYLQFGAEAADSDPCVGFAVNGDAAARLCEAVNILPERCIDHYLVALAAALTDATRG
jgi:hypothetical protein